MNEYDLERVEKAITVLSTLCKNEMTKFSDPDYFGSAIGALMTAQAGLETVAGKIKEEMADKQKQDAILDAKIKYYQEMNNE